MVGPEAQAVSKANAIIITPYLIVFFIISPGSYVLLGVSGPCGVAWPHLPTSA
jgi:hypothetical protein